MSDSFGSQDLFVSLEGNDSCLGNRPDVDKDGKNGPFKTIEAAKNAVRLRKKTGLLQGPLTVWLRGGRYELSEPLVFDSQDSAPVTYRSYPGETATISGGKRIESWKEDSVNGVACWVAQLPEVADGEWSFRQLFVNGKRRKRPRLPREGFHRVAGVPESDGPKDGKGKWRRKFFVKPGDFRASWSHIQDIEVISLNYWVDQHSCVESFDESTQTLSMQNEWFMGFAEDIHKDKYSRYYIENVLEELKHPGDWYLDRPTGVLYYIPEEGEELDNCEIVAPRHTYIMRIEGDPDNASHVEFIRFQDLTFMHSTVEVYKYGVMPDIQGAVNLPGAIYAEGAKHCAFEDCTFASMGGYALVLEAGSTHNRIVGNTMTDIGAGAIRLNGSELEGPACRRNSHNRITDNHLYDLGVIYHSGVGVLVLDSSDNIISHNHIHSMDYSAISLGWHWKFEQVASLRNWVEKNHIHDIGRGMLSDMGAIYLLSIQPGTVIKGNLIHDVNCYNYGGWAIYPDEGASYIVIEDNICYDVSSQPFQQHIGWENTVRNNIFAFGGLGCVLLQNGWSSDHKSYSLEGNILVTDGAPVTSGGYWGFFHLDCIVSDRNLIWDVGGKDLVFREIKADYTPVKDYTLDDWRNDFAHDLCSIIADPKFKDLENRDFELAEDSPAWKIGFRKIDMSDVGIRPAGQRDGGPHHLR